MHLEIPADVLEPYELRELVLLGERDLATILAQLGRNPVESQRFVDFLLGPPAYALRPPKHAVLVQLELLGLRDLAQLDVVRLRAREVLHRGAEA